MTFPYSIHLRIESFQDNISNSLIGSFYGTFKDWYNGREGFKTFTAAKQLICVYIVFLNLLSLIQF